MLRSVCLAAALLLPLAAHAETVIVFAAASLKNAMDDIAASYAEETGNEAAVSFAGSSALARQIQAGAPADVFISANTSWMDALQDDGVLVDGSRSDLLGNSIVLIAHGEAEPLTISENLPLPDMLGGSRLAMALIDSVPAGIYGKAALESLGLWDAVSPQVAQADNVRAALALVATGEAPYGIVYATDAVAEDDVTPIGTFPEGSHDPIIYPAALTSFGGSDAGQQFLDYLTGPVARDAFERQGFTVLSE